MACGLEETCYIIQMIVRKENRMSDKRLSTRESKSIKVYNPEPIYHVPGAKEEKSNPKVGFPLLILSIAFALFLLAFAGSQIGNLLGYLVLPALAFFPGLIMAEWAGGGRAGKIAGILAGLLIVAVLAPAYGLAVIEHSISFFTSLQKISQSVLVIMAMFATFAGLTTLIVNLRKR
jgi:hypothetical protein